MSSLKRIQEMRLRIMRSQYKSLKSTRAKELLERKASRLKKELAA